MTILNAGMADMLVQRDRDVDDRRLSLECTHLAGFGPSSWRCGNWQAADVAIRVQDNQLPGDFAPQLQRCDGFDDTFRDNVLVDKPALLGGQRA